MAVYIAPEYEEIENNLLSFSEEHGLDIVTVKSLIRGSIEIQEGEIPKASLIGISEEKLNSGISVKTRNIRVNFRFAISSIFTFKQVCDSKGLWLVLAILKAIIFLTDEIMVDLDKEDAVVVFCLYRLRNATSEELITYANKLSIEGQKTDIQGAGMEQVLEKLEKIGAIQMTDGKYCLRETVLVRRMIK